MPTTGDTSPYYPYNCDPDGTRGLIPATVNTVGATECACADPDKVVIGGRQVGVSGTTVTVNVGGRCAVCPNDHVLPDGACAADALTAANAALRAEIEKDPPDVVAVRRALDKGANPNITTSAGIPVLVAAALGLHAEVISVLITAGADPYGESRGNSPYARTTPRRCPLLFRGLWPSGLFATAGRPPRSFPSGGDGRRRLFTLETPQATDLTGRRWTGADRTASTASIFTFTAGELVLGFMQMTRAL